MKKKLALILAAVTTMTFAVPTFATETKSASDKKYVDVKDEIMPYTHTSYDFKNFPINTTSRFPGSILLKKQQPYGKVFYYNSSSNRAKLTVDGVKTIIIPPNSGNSIRFKKASFKSEYGFSIKSLDQNSKEGVVNLNGTLSTAISDKPFTD